MKKTIITFLLLLLVTSLLMGCEGTSGSSGSSTKSAGLSMELTSKKVSIYDSDYVDFEVIIKNKGSYTVPAQKAVAQLSGYDQTLFSFGNNGIIRLPELEGKTSDYEGYVDYVSFGRSKIKQGYLNENLPKLSPTFVINLCYPYETKSSTEICINPGYYTGNSNSGCKPGNAKTHNSNAPVKISSVKERYITYDEGSNNLDVKFDITVTNSGNGKLWSPLREAYLYECGKPQENFKEVSNMFKIKSVMMSGKSLNCKADNNVVRMIGNSVTFSCTGTINAPNSFTTQLDIELDYGYSTEISQKVDIISSKYGN